MTVKKLSIALDGDIALAASQSARREGMSLSAWLNRAAASALIVERGLAAVADWETRHGALTRDELDEADRKLATAARKQR